MMTELIQTLRQQMTEEQLRHVPAADWTALPQLLLANYRYLVADGYPVTLGRTEVNVQLVVGEKGYRLDNPAGSYNRPAPEVSTDETAGRRETKDGRYHANQATNGSFKTGAHGQRQSGQAGALRLRASGNAGLGVAPGLLNSVSVGASVSGQANVITRGTGHIKDAEVARVEDTRDDSTLLAFDSQWRFRLRSDPAATWEQSPLVDVTRTSPDRLILAVADHNLQQTGPQVRAVPPVKEELKAEFADNAARIPPTFFASGLTGLSKLGDEIITLLREGGADVSIGGDLRKELHQKLTSLDTGLNTAVNDPKGHRITLHENGRVVAEVYVKASRLADAPERVGSTSDKAHIERVGTAISGNSGDTGIRNTTSARVSVDANLVPIPEVGVTGSVYGGKNWNNFDSMYAGRAGLWVHVSRYTGFTGGHDLKLKYTASVSVIQKPKEDAQKTPEVSGSALLRIPEPDAFAFGFSVDADAVSRTPDGKKPGEPSPTVPYDPDLLRNSGSTPGDPVGVPLPLHVLDGHGIGQGLVRVDEAAARDLRGMLLDELSKKGFVPPDLDRPFWMPGVPLDLNSETRLDSWLDNLGLIQQMVSEAGLNSHYNALHQDGLPFTVHDRGELGQVRSARVTLFAKKKFDAGTVSERRTGEYHTVNLAMGMDNFGYGAGGGREWVAGAKAKAGSQNMPFAGYFRAGAEYALGSNTRQNVGFLTNRPELLEYPGKVDEYRLLSEFGVRVEYDDGTAPTSFSDDYVATTHLIPAFNPSPAPAADPPADTPAVPAAELGDDAHGGRVVLPPVHEDVASVASTEAVAPDDDAASDATARPEPAAQPRRRWWRDWRSRGTRPGRPATPAAQSGQPAGSTSTRHDPSVLDQAAIYYFDTTGVVPALRDMVPQLTGPGKANDEEVSNFGGTVMVAAHLKEILQDRYATDTLFRAGMRASRHGAVSIGGSLGDSSFVGATNDKYVLGLIKLQLVEASQARSKVRGFSVSPATVGLGGNPDSRLTNVGQEKSAQLHWGQSTSETSGRTGGKEFLDLDFHRAYAFRAPVDLTLRSQYERRGKMVMFKGKKIWLLSHRRRSAARQLGERNMIYLLAEPEALARYGEGAVPLSNEQLEDALTRWQVGEKAEQKAEPPAGETDGKAADEAEKPLLLPGDVVAEVLLRWRKELATAGASDSSAAASRQRLAELARTLAKRHADLNNPIMNKDVRRRFAEAFPVTLADPVNAFANVRLPEYLTKDGDRALGHSAVHSTTLVDEAKKSTDLYTMVHEAVEQAAPGLLGRRPDLWDNTQGTIGRVQGALDALQGMFASGRDHALIEELLHRRGIKIELTNPVGWGNADVVTINIRMKLTGDPEVRALIGDSGIENYGHGYVRHVTSSGRDSSRSLDYMYGGRASPAPAGDRRSASRTARAGPPRGLSWARRSRPSTTGPATTGWASASRSRSR
ncbi:hypothetical protein ACFQZ4_43235 [Catellatospora coxensis]